MVRLPKGLHLLVYWDFGVHGGSEFFFYFSEVLATASLCLFNTDLKPDSFPSRMPMSP